MPLHEYECRDCGHRFEYLVRGSSTASCPACHSSHLDRMLSVFAVSTGSATKSDSFAAGPCGTCGDPRGPGACSMN